MSTFFLNESAGPATNLRAAISASLAALCPIDDLEDGVRVTTGCLYPSNGLVRVFVRGGKHTVVVTDDGEAVGEALSAGIEIEDADRLLRHFARDRGLSIHKGSLITPMVELEAASVAIVQVANAAKDAANWLYDRGGMKRRYDFKQLLSAFLADTFKEHVSETHILGASQKPHKFANVITFANGRKLIVDAVSNDSSSINARVVANLDVKAMRDSTIDQRIIYDDAEKWTSADLNLLQVGATIVPFSRSKEVIRRVADEARVAA